MSGRDKARILLAEAVHAQLSAIPDDARIGAFERWDSLAHLRLLLTLELQLGRPLDADEAIRIECLDDIAVLLDQAGAAQPLKGRA
jgi:acyl carrier protein